MLMVGNLVAIAGLVALVAALQLQVRLVEEPYLHRTHNDDYDRYATSAGRFLPLLGRLRTPNHQAPPRTASRRR